MDFTMSIIRTYTTKDVSFIYEQLEQPLKKVLFDKNISEKIELFYFFPHIEPQKWMDDNLGKIEISRGRKMKSYDYTFWILEEDFNTMSEEESLKLFATHFVDAMERLRALKVKDFDYITFEKCIHSVIDQWL